ncbi:hypothetical protein [Sorangium sp. So ce233]|uniref:hypothetical protein n=1 Tax=Sorangium sp. So ce233 TaxID=3133290 RepID=UPI003F6300CD
MKLVKVTEAVGQHIYDGDADWISDLDGDGTIARLNDMIPEGAGGVPGRWRITVEFDPAGDDSP